MKRIGPMIVMVAALTPAAALAGTSTTVSANAAKQCSVLRTQLGMPAFSTNFSTFGLCVSELTPLARENLASARAACKGSSSFARCLAKFQTNVSLKAATTAAASCRAQQLDGGFAAAHGKTFARFYGTNRNNANAFGRCVSMKATASQSGLTPAPQQPTQSPTPAAAKTGGGSSECDSISGGSKVPQPMGTDECTIGVNG
jgi:hypothetical protein